MRIIADSNLRKIHNLPFFILKEKSLGYFFIIQHCLGKWCRCSDTISHHPVAMMEAFLCIFPQDVQISDNRDAIVESAILQAITDHDDKNVTLPELICASCQNDQNHTTLINSTENGFPNRSRTKLEICDFRELQHYINTNRGLV